MKMMEWDPPCGCLEIVKRQLVEESVIWRHVPEIMRLNPLETSLEQGLMETNNADIFSRRHVRIPTISIQDCIKSATKINGHDRNMS